MILMCYFGLSVDWLVEADVSEKRAVSITEDRDSTLLRNVEFYQPVHTPI
jgi:hypothetical protein